NFLSRNRGTGHRHDENFVVRAGRFESGAGLAVIDVASVSELLTVGRNRVHVLPAEMERRRIVIARREIARLRSVLLWWQPCRLRARGRCRRHACLYSCVRADDEKMATLEFGERVPVSIEQSREDFRFHFALLQLFIAFLVAVVGACRAGAWRRRVAIWINRRHEY